MKKIVLTVFTLLICTTGTEAKKRIYKLGKMGPAEPEYQIDKNRKDNSKLTLSAKQKYAEQISIDIFYNIKNPLKGLNPQQDSDRLHFEPKFMLSELALGLSLTITVIPPSTGKENNKFLIIAMLRNSTGTKVAKEYLQIELPSPPTAFIINYGGSAATEQREIFTGNDALSADDNNYLFNKTAPLIIRKTIRQTAAGIVVE